MKKRIITVLFLLQCIFLFGGPKEIFFGLDNKSNNEIIVTTILNTDFFPEGESGPYSVIFLSEEGEEIYTSVNAYNVNENRMPGDYFHLMDIIQKPELLTLTPLEIFNTVVTSFRVTDTNGNILLTEKDITNDSFVRDSWIRSDGTEGSIFFTIIFTLEE